MKRSGSSSASTTRESRNATSTRTSCPIVEWVRRREDRDNTGKAVIFSHLECRRMWSENFWYDNIFLVNATHFLMRFCCGNMKEEGWIGLLNWRGHLLAAIFQKQKTTVPKDRNLWTSSLYIWWRLPVQGLSFPPLLYSIGLGTLSRLFTRYFPLTSLFLSAIIKSGRTRNFPRFTYQLFCARSHDIFSLVLVHLLHRIYT